jgi:glycosyltransferase involved in cell wall biosynthesis
MFTLDPQLTSFARSQLYAYAADQDVATPDVTVVVIADAPGVDWGALVQCLAHQSLQYWRCLIIFEGGLAAEPSLMNLIDGGPRIRTLRSRSRAESIALALEQTSGGDYICCLDSHSLIEPTFLEKCVWLLGCNEQIAFCNAQSLVRSEPATVWSYGFEQRAKFLDENFAGSSYVIRRAVYVAAMAEAPAAPSGYEIWDLWLRLAHQGHWGYTIPEQLIVYMASNDRAPFRPEAISPSFRAYVAERYAGLRRQFPQVRLADPQPFEQIAETFPLQNRLAKPADTRRLLILMPWLIVGGAERVNLDIIQYLTSAGYEVSFATTLLNAQHSWLAEFARYTSDIFLLDHFLRLPDFPRFLVYLIQSRQIDTVMVSNSYLGYQLLPYLRACCPEVTFVDYCHSEQEDWKNGGYPRCGAAYQELLDLNIASSLHVKEWMVERGAQPSRIEVCYTNVDVIKWHPDPAARQATRSQLGLSEDMTLIIFVGRLSVEKRPTLLAQIVRELQARDGGRFLCLVLGDGPERGSLEHQVRSLRLQSHMKLLGRVSDADLHNYMAAADIFLLPSAVEGISVAIFEAMAMGLVPIGARVGGQSELVTPDCGALISHSPNELAEYVAALRRLLYDRALCQQTGANARARVERLFPLSALGPRMAELFEQAAALHREAPRPPVGRGVGREYAAQAIEYTRLEHALDLLWRERESWRSSPIPHPTIAMPPAGLRRRLALFLRARTIRWYRWGLAHGMDWLIPLKERTVGWAKRHGW